MSDAVEERKDIREEEQPLEDNELISSSSELEQKNSAYRRTFTRKVMLEQLRCSSIL